MVSQKSFDDIWNIEDRKDHSNKDFHEQTKQKPENEIVNNNNTIDALYHRNIYRHTTKQCHWRVAEDNNLGDFVVKCKQHTCTRI